jgi:hypothetical protein
VNLLGIRLQLMIGSSLLPRPAPAAAVEALQSVEVTHTGEGRSGFQLSFGLERSGPGGLLDYSLLKTARLEPFQRILLTVTLGAFPPCVLMDGIITHHQVAPGDASGGGILTVTGEDLSILMDLEEKRVQYPGQSEAVRVEHLLGRYRQYGVIPKVIPPRSLEVPLVPESTPGQQGTDLDYLVELAERFGYLFHVTPGPVPLQNTAYWGPKESLGRPQKALSMNMGPDTNVLSLSFQNDALAPTLVEGAVQDGRSNEILPIKTVAGTRPPLSSSPSLLAHRGNLRKKWFDQSGLTVAQAFARAQAMTDASADTITAEGELDVLRYESLLRPHGLVGLRGAGYSYDGLYYVRRVTHSIRRGEYRQRFTLTRDGVGSLVPMVKP